MLPSICSCSDYLQSVFQFISEVLDGTKIISVQSRQVLLQQIWKKYFFMGLVLRKGTLSCWNERGPQPTLDKKTKMSHCSLERRIVWQAVWAFIPYPWNHMSVPSTHSVFVSTSWTFGRTSSASYCTSWTTNLTSHFCSATSGSFVQLVPTETLLVTLRLTRSTKVPTSWLFATRS